MRKHSSIQSFQMRWSDWLRFCAAQVIDSAGVMVPWTAGIGCSEDQVDSNRRISAVHCQAPCFCGTRFAGRTARSTATVEAWRVRLGVRRPLEERGVLGRGPPQLVLQLGDQAPLLQARRRAERRGMAIGIEGAIASRAAATTAGLATPRAIATLHVGSDMKALKMNDATTAATTRNTRAAIANRPSASPSTNRNNRNTKRFRFGGDLVEAFADMVDSQALVGVHP